MKKTKLLKNSTINKLIMGGCLMGVLSTVRCDNEPYKKSPNLQKVNLSARQTDKGVQEVIKTGTAYLKLTITKDEAGNRYANYYKTIQDKNPENLHDLKFPMRKDGSIDAFFLKASESGNTYWVQQFDIYDKDPDDTTPGMLQYSLSEKKNFILKKEDSDNNVTIDAVKKESADTVISVSLKAPSFSIRTVEGYSFKVGFLNKSQQWFGKSTDYKIHFTVKHGNSAAAAKAVSTDNADYDNEDIFGGTKDGNSMKIILPRSKYYYEDKVFVVDATVKRTVSGSVEHRFTTVGNDDADTQIKAGVLLLKIINQFPTIKVTGGDGSNPYSDANKTFSLSNSANIKIFKEPGDLDNDPLKPTVYKWTLYKNRIEVSTAGIQPNTTSNTADPFSELSSYNKPSIQPTGLMIAKSTTLASQTDIDSYTLKGYAKVDDGLGGITEKTVEFNFTK